MKNLYSSMKRGAALSAAFLLTLGNLSGCGRDRSIPEPGEEYLLYVEQGGSSLVPVAWQPSGEEAGDTVQEALDEMRTPEKPGRVCERDPRGGVCGGEGPCRTGSWT